MSEKKKPNYCIREYELDEVDEAKCLSLYQLIEGDVNSVVWDASLTLAGYIQKLNRLTPNFLKDKKVIELGAGIGLCGMVASYLGANTILTDMKGSLDLLIHNVEENKKKYPSEMTATVEELIWSSESATALCEKHKFDYILMADCVYYKESIDPLVETLKIITSTDTTVLICQELRESKVQIDLFKEFLRKIKEFLVIREVSQGDQHEDYHCEEIMVFSCKRK